MTDDPDSRDVIDVTTTAQGHLNWVRDLIAARCPEVGNDEGYWSWEIRWRDGRKPVESNWTYTSERLARDEAEGAVLVLA
jgi:hypothetical protein